MAKKSYGVPIDLQKSRLEIPIPMNAFGFRFRHLLLKDILLYITVVMAWYSLISRPPISEIGLGFIAIFSIMWFLIAVLLLKKDKTGQYQALSVPVVWKYLQKQNRQIITRRNSDLTDLKEMVGIRTIDNQGKIHFQNGKVGVMYRVVGSASLLLFEEDKVAILDRVDRFYQQMDTSVELFYLTRKEPQKVKHQYDAFKDKAKALNVPDKELQELLLSEMHILKEFVGGAYHSVHQYMMVIAPNEELLKRTQTTIHREVEVSSLMFKEIELQSPAQIVEQLRFMYTGGQEK